MSIKMIIGYIGLHICNILPANGSKLNFGQKSVRGFFARMFLDQCGLNVNIQKNTRFSHTCHIGNNSGIGENSVLYGKVCIGDNVMMGTECLIYTQNHAFEDLTIPMNKQGFQPSATVIIGDNVWIGGRVTILPGVHIGDGVVIGAGAVVTKDIENNAIVGGNPAKVIRIRGEK